MKYKFIILALTVIAMVACGTDKQHVKLEGKLLNIDQGEFLVYSPDGAMPGIDTLKVKAGRFELLTQCNAEGTALIVMPNGTEVAVFIEPGASVTLNGDAQNLSKIEVKGTEANKLMTEYRLAAAGKSIKEQGKIVSDMLAKNPLPVVGMYLVRKVLINVSDPDYATATKVLDVLTKSNSDNVALKTMATHTREIMRTAGGKTLPAFKATDISGREVTQDAYSKGVAVISAFATFDYESIQQLRNVHDIKVDDDSVKILAISLDASKTHLEQALGNDKSSWTTICDGNMTDGTLPRTLSLFQPAATLLVKDGKIISRNLKGEPLYSKIREIMKNS